MRPTAEQLDAITEVINMGVGRAASSLNELVQAHVTLTVPRVMVLTMDSLEEALQELDDDVLSSVQLTFHGALDGSALLVFPANSALYLVTVLAQDESNPTDLDSIRAGTLTEVGNIVINGVVGTISNMLTKPMRFSLPRYHEGRILQHLCDQKCHTSDAILLAKTRFQIEKFEIEGNILLLFELASFDCFLEAIDTMLADTQPSGTIKKH